MLALIKSLPLTFYSIPFYQRLARNGRGIGLGFLFIATLLGLAQVAIYLTGPVRAVWDERAAIFDALPPMAIQDGVISVDAPSPTEITFLKNNPTGSRKIVFDVKTDDSDLNRLIKRMDDESIFALVTKTRVILYDKDSGQREVTEAKTMDNAVVSHEKWVRIGEILGAVVPVFAAVSLGFFVFLNHLFSAFCGALFLFALTALFKLDLSFAALLRLTAAAKIPVGSFFLFLPPNPLIQLLLWLGFAVFGLLAARKAG